MNNADQEYFRLLDLVLKNGRVKKNRTGVDTIGVFGEQARFDLSKGFPLLTTKKVFFKGIVHELLWFLSGSTNIKYLVDNDVHIWDEWCYAKYKKTEPKMSTLHNYKVIGVNHHDHFPMPEFIKMIKKSDVFADQWGDLGEGTYGGMWRAFPYATEETPIRHVDQIQNIIDKLKTNPDDRRLVVSAWHPHWVEHCALPPCHALFQFHTEELTEEERSFIYQRKTGQGPPCEGMMDEVEVPKRRLNCQLYQRSCDLFLGVPFNIASYALLTHLVAQAVGMEPGIFSHCYGDLHLYHDHIDKAKEQMTREPFPLPRLFLNPLVNDIFSFLYDDIGLENYQSHPAIKAAVAV